MRNLKGYEMGGGGLPNACPSKLQYLVLYWFIGIVNKDRHVTLNCFVLMVKI